MDKFLQTEHQNKVFKDRYQHGSETIEQSFMRVASCSAKEGAVLGLSKEEQTKLFYEGLTRKHFTPAGRPIANIGGGYNNMLFNCFVIGIDDSRQGITSSLGDFMEIAALGGGIGSSFGSLRPKGDRTVASNGTASGPVSFINVFQELATTIKQAGTRGLATLITMPIYHPDIESFITAKYEEGKWSNANISIGITHEFMKCVEQNLDFNLSWKDEVRKTVKATELWDKICTLAHRNGEPGILFLDTMNEDSPYNGYETLDSTNPCISSDSPVNTSNGTVLAKDIQQDDWIETLVGYERVYTIEVTPGKYTYDVIFADETSITVTESHVFYTLGKDGSLEEALVRSLDIGEFLLVSTKKEKDLVKVYPEEAKRLRQAIKPLDSSFKEVVDIVWKGTETVYDFYCKGSDTYVVNSVVSRGCGEVALPHNGACNLGSVIVSSFVDLKSKKIDYTKIENASYNLTIWLDNLIDISTFPTKAIEGVVKKYRPIGVGAMGLADALLYMGIPYGNNPEAILVAEGIAEAIEEGSLRASEDLAKQFGAFPAYDPKISKFAPRRNLTLTSYAPTGSISALFDVSSGIESLFAVSLRRNEELGTTITQNGSLGKYMNFHNTTEIPNHARFSISGPKGSEVSTEDHLAILKAIVPYAQSGISKTIILDNSATVEDVSRVYKECWKFRSKGVTVYRTGSRDEVPIEDAEIKTKIKIEDNYEDLEVEFIDCSSKPKTRPNELEGSTYKVKFNHSQHSMFITINDFEGELYEIFFKINNSIHQEYLDGLSRAITTLWRRGIDTSHLMSEFAEYESLSGGSFYEYKKGKNVNLKSVLHAVSVVVNQHLARMETNIEGQGCIAKLEVSGIPSIPKGELCPECKENTMHPVEGCATCLNCGYSKCG